MITPESPYFPKISHTACAHVPNTDWVIIWGGDQNQQGSIGSEYIAVKLNLAPQNEQEFDDKIHFKGNK